MSLIPTREEEAYFKGMSEGLKTLGPLPPSSGSALSAALDDGQEVKMFKLMGAGAGYCITIHGDCYLEVRSKPTLDAAITEAAAMYVKWSNETE